MFCQFLDVKIPPFLLGQNYPLLLGQYFVNVARFARKLLFYFCMDGNVSRLEKVWQAPSYRHLVTREKAPKAATLAALQLLV